MAVLPIDGRFMKQPVDYRPDIDGLRAIAVLSVLIFHYGASWMPGGFVGVDVFFVISGYLITKGLAQDITRNGYLLGPLLLRFYNKRIRRIAPALITVLAATLAAGWFLLMPGDYVTLGQSAAYSAFGLGNFYFYKSTGYFDRAAELQPLLHMWSLGVEEQFYLVWPILLLGVMWWTAGRRNLTLAIILMIVTASFVLALYTVTVNPKAAFFLPLPRIWELGIGAAVAFVPKINSKWAANLMGAAGLALIGSAVLLVEGGEASPGWPMVPAVVGSALLVWPRIANLPSQLLSIAPMRFVGLISYSLYLWHWPVLVLFRFYINGDMPTPIEAAALTAISVVLATLSWRYVERPARTIEFPPLAAIGTGIGSAAMIAAVSLWVVHAEGFYNRLSEQAQAMRSLDVMWRFTCPYKMNMPEFGRDGKNMCVVGASWKTATRRAIIWGDSHASHLAPLVQNAASGEISYLVYNPCPAAVGKTVQRLHRGNPNYIERCEKQRQSLLQKLDDDPSIEALILAASWGPLVSRLRRFDGMANRSGIELLKEGLAEFLPEVPPSVRVVLVGQFPYPEADPVPCELAAENILQRRRCHDAGTTVFASTFTTVEPVNIVFEQIKADFTQIALLLPSRQLCDNGTCVTRLDNIPLFRDGSHLRRNLPVDVLRNLADLSGLSEVLASIEQP